jgi:hypothetical protein
VYISGGKIEVTLHKGYEPIIFLIFLSVDGVVVFKKIPGEPS